MRASELQIAGQERQLEAEAQHLAACKKEERWWTCHDDCPVVDKTVVAAAQRPARKPVKSIPKLEATDTPTVEAVGEPVAAVALEPDKKAAEPNKYTDHAIEARRTHVLQLRLRGLTIKEIADRLSVSEMTVTRDMAAARDAGTTAISNFNKDQEIADSLTTYDDIIRAGWLEFDGAAGTELKVKTLQLIRQTKNDKMKLVQDIGLVSREAHKVELNVDLKVLDSWTKELQEIAINGLLQAALKTPMLAPIPDVNVIDAVVVAQHEDDSDQNNGE